MQLAQALTCDPDTTLLTFSVREGFAVVPLDGAEGRLARSLLERDPRSLETEIVVFEDAKATCERCLLVVGLGWAPPLDILVQTREDIPGLVAALQGYLDVQHSAE